MITAGLLRLPNVQAWLRVIREGESSQGPEAYYMQVGGRLLADLDAHPRDVVTVTIKGKEWRSSAAGAYQFLARTWDECAKALGLVDFGPKSQDLAALYLTRRRGALDDVIAGRIDDAIRKCAAEWASLPGDVYGQGGKTMAQALLVWANYGGSAAPKASFEDEPLPATPAEQTSGWNVPAGEAPDGVQLGPEPTPINPLQEAPMAPILAAVLPSIVQAIPRLGALFGSGSDVSQRNVKAAETVVGIVSQAVGALNAQDAAEKLQADPQARAVAAQAIEAQWYVLTAEAGGGGIDGARKADAAATPTGQPWRSPSMWALLLLLPLAYMVVGSVVGIWGSAEWSPDVRAAISTAVVSLIIGGAAGYYWGATTSRNRPGAQP